MTLDGIVCGDEYRPARGTSDGVPYRIAEWRGRFVLERVGVACGIGSTATPVGMFGDEWRGVYSQPTEHRT